MAESENNDESVFSTCADDTESDPKLDFYSEKFDPLIALRVSTVKVPDETAKVFDNLSSYNAANEREQNPKAKKEKKEVDNVEIIRRWLPEQSRFTCYINSLQIQILHTLISKASFK